MTRKDYIAIADIFHKYMVIEADIAVNNILSDLMQYMKQDNPRVNKTKFLEKVAAPYPQ